MTEPVNPNLDSPRQPDKFAWQEGDIEWVKKAPPTPADELRTAAARLRELATDATPGPWRQHDTHLGQYGHTATVLSGERNTTELRAWLPTMSQESWDDTRNVWADSAYIAAMHPGVGAALAAWLDETAHTYDANVAAAAQVFHDDPAGRDTYLATGLGAPSEHALAVARAINQTEEPTK